MTKSAAARTNIRIARSLWDDLTKLACLALKELVERYGFSISSGDLTCLQGRWYVTHTGLLHLARRNRCAGIHVRPVPEFSDVARSRWAFKATVYKSRNCRGFAGFGDADPTNVAPLVRGAEMRVAETRAVTGRCARPTGSESALSRRSDLSGKRLILDVIRIRFQLNLLMEVEADCNPGSEIAFANLSANTNSIPSWSSPMLSISAKSKP